MLLDYKNERDYIYNITKPNGGKLKTDIILIGYIISQMKKGFSPIILVVGKQRIGKSFIAVWLAWRIFKFFNPGEDLDIKKFTFYDPLLAISKLNTLNKNPLIVDEAGAMVNKMEFYSKVTIALDKIIQTQGYLTNCYIFISPFGSDIAKTFRKHFSHIVHVRRRGVLTVKEIPKKYDDLTGKVPRPYTVEQIKVSKKCVPKDLWNTYEEFSKEQKEVLRKDLHAKNLKIKKDFWNREVGFYYD